MNKTKFTDFYEAWWYLNETDVFKLKSVPEHLKFCNEESNFLQSLCIDVQKVNPETCEIDDDEKLNTKVEVWLECGEPFYNEDLDCISTYHSWKYDCGGNTFEEAILELANIVYAEKFILNGSENPLL